MLANNQTNIIYLETIDYELHSTGCILSEKSAREVIGNIAKQNTETVMAENGDAIYGSADGKDWFAGFFRVVKPRAVRSVSSITNICVEVAGHEIQSVTVFTNEPDAVAAANRLLKLRCISKDEKAAYQEAEKHPTEPNAVVGLMDAHGNHAWLDGESGRHDFYRIAV